jgi:hypothetical protein
MRRRSATPRDAAVLAAPALIELLLLVTVGGGMRGVGIMLLAGCGVAAIVTALRVALRR